MINYEVKDHILKDAGRPGCISIFCFLSRGLLLSQNPFSVSALI